MVNIGFIGYGRFARLRHNILSQIPDVGFSGFYDVNISLKNETDLRRFESPDELIDNSDGVMISVPPNYAPKFCEKALKMGAGVFCEKPPAAHLSQLMRLEQYGLSSVLAYGFNHRLHESVIKIRETIDSNLFGRILWMRGRYGKEVDEDYRHGWRCNKELNGGGILIDQGIHLLDIMDWLAGGFDVNQAILSNGFLGIPGIEDNAFVNLYSSNEKISASLHSTITQWRYLFSLEIFLEKGSIILNGLRTSSGNYGKEILSLRPKASSDADGLMEDTVIEYSINTSWEREMSAFVHCLQNQSNYPFTGLTDAKNIMALITSIYDNAIWAEEQ